MVIQCHIHRGYVVGVIWKMAFTKKNEEAVSPVIGVILMVAITVILAAVIAAFVFGMAGNIQKTKVVAATEQRNSSAYVIVTYQGGQDAMSLTRIAFTVDGENTTLPAAQFSSTNNLLVADGNNAVVARSGSSDPIPVGASILISAANPGKNHIVGIGTFNDGSNQVIVDSTL